MAHATTEASRALELFSKTYSTQINSILSTYQTEKKLNTFTENNIQKNINLLKEAGEHFLEQDKTGSNKAQELFDAVDLLEQIMYGDIPEAMNRMEKVTNENEKKLHAELDKYKPDLFADDLDQVNTPALNGHGRNTSRLMPPAQIRTCRITAYGSYFEYLTSNRSCGYPCTRLSRGKYNFTSFRNFAHVIRLR